MKIDIIKTRYVVSWSKNHLTGERLIHCSKTIWKVFKDGELSMVHVKEISKIHSVNISSYDYQNCEDTFQMCYFL